MDKKTGTQRNENFSKLSVKRLPLNIPSAVAIFAPWVYALGSVSKETSLLSFGLGMSQFSPNLHQVMLSGFIVAGSMLLYVSPILIILDYLFLKKGKDGKRRIAFLLPSNLISRFKGHTGNREIAAADSRVTPGSSEPAEKRILPKFIATALIVYLSLVVSLIYAVIYGEKMGENALADCAKDEVVVSKVYLKETDGFVRGCKIICNSSQCAYLVGRQTVVLNFDGSTFEAIELLPHKAKRGGDS